MLSSSIEPKPTEQSLMRRSSTSAFKTPAGTARAGRWLTVVFRSKTPPSSKLAQTWRWRGRCGLRRITIGAPICRRSWSLPRPYQIGMPPSG